MALVDLYGRPFPVREQEPTLQRVDGWLNAQTGINVPGLDKQRGGHYYPVRRVLDQELANLYSGSDLAAKVVEKRPLEMFRRGFDLEADGVKASDIRDLREFAEEYFDLNTTLVEGKIFGRLFGGALGLLGLDDGGMPWEPLNEDRIRGFNYISIVDRRYSYVQSQYSGMSTAKSKYGKSQIYLVSNAIASSTWIETGDEARLKSQKELLQQGAQVGLVHESRTLRFDGNRTDVQARLRLGGWTWSVLQRVYDAMQQFEHSFDSVGHLLTDASQGVLKLQGLLKAITSGQRQALADRLQMMEMTRSTLRGIALDGGDKEGNGAESFERVQTPFGGIPDLMDRMMLRLAAAADMPITELFGVVPGGLQGGGAGDNATRKWYDTIASEQENDLAPVLRRIFRLLALAKTGPLGGKDVKWKIHFKPLWSPTDKEVSDVTLANSTRDVAYITAGVVKPEEVAVGLADVYPKLDVEAREEVLKAGTSFEPYENDPEPEPPVPGAPGAPPGGGDPAGTGSTNQQASGLGEPDSPAVPLPLIGAQAKAPLSAAAAATTPGAPGAKGTLAKPGAVTTPKPLAGKPGIKKAAPPGAEAAPAAAAKPTAAPSKGAAPAVKPAPPKGAPSKAPAPAAPAPAPATTVNLVLKHQAGADKKKSKGDGGELERVADATVADATVADAADPSAKRSELGHFAEEDATEASREANAKSAALADAPFPTRGQHRAAETLHRQAAKEHDTLSLRHLRLGNGAAADKHAKIADAHDAKALEHTKLSAREPPGEPARAEPAGPVPPIFDVDMDDPPTLPTRTHAYDERNEVARDADEATKAGGDGSHGEAAAAHYSARAFARKLGHGEAADDHTDQIKVHEAAEQAEYETGFRADDTHGHFPNEFPAQGGVTKGHVGATRKGSWQHGKGPEDPGTSEALSASREATAQSGVAQMFGGAEDHRNAAAAHTNAATLLHKMAANHLANGKTDAAAKDTALAAHHEANASSHTAEAEKLEPSGGAVPAGSHTQGPSVAKAVDPGRSAGARKSAETRGQNDEFAKQNLPDHLHPLWMRMKAGIKGSPHERAEKLQEYAEANPHEAMSATIASSEKKLSGMIREHMRAQRVDSIEPLTPEPGVVAPALEPAPEPKTDDQEHLPAGTPEGGQFAAKGGGSGSGESAKSATNSESAAGSSHAIAKSALQKVAAKLRGAPAALGKLAVDKVKGQIHEAKEAFAGVKAMLHGQKMTDEQKSAVKHVAVKVATSLLASTIAGALPLGALAHGILSEKVVEKLSHHVLEHVLEHLAKKGLHLDAAGADDPEAWLGTAVAEGVAEALEGLSDDDLASVLGVKADGSPDQPRDKDGKFGSGGGGASAHPNAEKAKELTHQAFTHGGFTYRAGGDAPKDGYLVSSDKSAGQNDIVDFHELSAKGSFAEAEKEATARVEAYLDKHLPFVNANADHYAGGYIEKAKDKEGHDDPHGAPVALHLDVNGHHADKDEALALGKARNQISIWSLTDGVEIPTGGTGR